MPESAAERTDPLLPVISAEAVPSAAPPALDDRRLAGLLAELDAEDLLPDSADDRTEAHIEAHVAGNLDDHTDDQTDARTDARAAGPHAGPVPAPRPPAASALPEPRQPVRMSRSATGPLPAVVDALTEPAESTARYVRREYQPPLPEPADALSLTGLTRVTGSRVGTVLFTAFFLGIFVLILVEVVVSLLRASS